MAVCTNQQLCIPFRSVCVCVGVCVCVCVCRRCAFCAAPLIDRAVDVTRGLDRWRRNDLWLTRRQKKNAQTPAKMEVHFRRACIHSDWPSYRRQVSSRFGFGFFDFDPTVSACATLPAPPQRSKLRYDQLRCPCVCVCVCVRVFSGRQLRPGALGDAVGNWIRLDLCNWPHGISIRPGPTLGAYRRFKFVNAAVGRLSLE